MLTTNQQILGKIADLYMEVFEHEGYGDLKIEMRILRRGQKEVIVHCGKQYRYVVDFRPVEASSQSDLREISALPEV